MKSKEPQACWEYWNCPEEDKKNCLAYTVNAGKLCRYTTNDDCPHTKRDFGSCLECGWFKSQKDYYQD